MIRCLLHQAQMLLVLRNSIDSSWIDRQQYNYVYIVGDDFSAVQNERQPRNTATIRPEALVEMDQERALREAAVAVGVFG